MMAILLANALVTSLSLSTKPCFSTTVLSSRNRGLSLNTRWITIPKLLYGLDSQQERGRRSLNLISGVDKITTCYRSFSVLIHRSKHYNWNMKRKMGEGCRDYSKWEQEMYWTRKMGEGCRDYSKWEQEMYWTRKMGEGCMDYSKWEQEMYWTHFQSIRFFQVLPKGFDQQLDIPVKFARNMKKKLPKNVTVIGPSGAKWNVGLVAGGDTLLFKHGWKKFVEDHFLKEDDVLIFRYIGDSRFDVLIFNGRSFCERESSYFIRKCEHTEVDPGFQTTRNMGESEGSVEVGHDSKRPRNNENLQSARLGQRTQARTRDGASDVITHHGKRVAAKKVNSGSYHLQYVSTRRPITEEEKENALKMACAASTPNSFRIVMRPSHVYKNFFMAIPSEWVHSHLPRKSQDVTLRMKENEKTWHAKYKCRVGVGASSGLDGGWKDFAFENNLEESDVCLFELASGTHDGIVMDVSIFRVVAEVSAPTRVSRSPTKRGRRRKCPRN